MPYVPRKKKYKAPSVNRTLYIPADLLQRVLELCKENDESFSQTVNSMIEYCIDDIDNAAETERN